MPQNSDNLNPRQKEAVEHKDGPILIAAGAGSGKTKTLTSRLAWLIKNGAPPENIIAITFTNKAANEMRDRVSISEHRTSNIEQCFIGTFHSLGARILKQEAGLVDRTPNYTIFDDDDSLSILRKTMKAMDLDKEKYNPIVIHRVISKIKNELLEPEEFDKITALVFQKYEERLIKNNGFDFDDLIEKVVKIFKNHPEVLKKYRDKFRYILVDEYQDINSIQYQMIRMLAEQHQNLSVVGDDAQAIYSFRGADFRNFLNFQEDWPNAKIVKLEQNYRSSGTIIVAASEVIKKNKMQTPKTLWTENAEGEVIKIVNAGNAEEEAAFVTEQISRNSKHEIRNPKQIPITKIQNSKPVSNFDIRISNFPTTAVLYRTNAQSRAIEQALISADIPYKVFGGLKFYERKEIKDLVAGLRLAHNPKDTVSLERLEKNFDKKTYTHLAAELPRLGKNLSSEGGSASGGKILELINYFIVNANYIEYLEKNYKNYQERTENVNEFIRFASEFSAKGGSASGGQTLGEFLERISLLQSADSPTKEATNSLHPKPYTLNPVHLMTIHLAKGLEFDTVFLIGASEGLLPHQMSYGSMSELEEERRLMYVAMTRAKKDLYVSFSNTPSRFIYEIPPELTEFVNLNGSRNRLPDDDEMNIDGSF